MPSKLKIDDKLLALAADKLDEIGRHHGWWKSKHGSWRESDEIAQEEFLGIVWSIIKVYGRYDASSHQDDLHDIPDYQVQKNNDSYLIGIATEAAVLDVKCTIPQIEACLNLLRRPRLEYADENLGVFGEYEVRLNCCGNGETSIFVDGPEFDKARYQSSAIWVNEQALRTILESVLETAV